LETVRLTGVDDAGAFMVIAFRDWSDARTEQRGA
jgi:hypothetical protein